MIKIKGVSKEFKQKKIKIQALRAVSMEIRRLEFFGIVGASGSGKSTLLKLINGLDDLTAGEILIDGDSLKDINKKERRRKIQTIGMIFQQFNLLQNLTVRQNVGLPLKVQGKKNPQKVKEMLAFVGMEEHINNYPSQLSGGQKQRVAIARALTTAPSILLCDEPTSALDEHNGHEVMKLLKKTQEEFGTTIVFVSHELELIKQWCNRAAILEEGRLLAIVDVSKNQVVNSETSYYQKAMDYLT
ncbi:methionine ABC transporter ATP-binding protein [Vagococcus elongatus]|uniref:ABC transporter domain-containing protein n=1 Tax=Vagococcus elongatus TaxID=180344 RepID=A0A430AU01_9ENTE|nr:ATP-binding cassette domain-containing protein [Vagococcus elongatus]RSU11539.1 hypothetical protein CBF29_07605 [Vagococcus elongatus]